MTSSRVAIAFSLLALASLIYTYPLVLDPGHANRLDSPDAMFNTWILSWDLHQLGRDPLHLFDANIFFPEKGTLAYSENLLSAAILVAPVALFTDNPILLFNAAWLCGIVTTGIATFLLAFDVSGNRFSALLAALVFTLAPYRWAHVPHLQLQLAFGIPLSLYLVRRVVNRAGRGWMAALALTLPATFGSSVYYFVFAATVAPLVGLFALSKLAPSDRIRAAARLVVAAALGTLLTLPLAWPYVGKLESGTVRSLEAATRFSAGIVDYVSSFSLVHFWLPKASEPLFAGFVALGLAATAVVMERSRRETWCWIAVASTGFVLSLGPKAGLFTFLYETLAPYRALRVPSRAGILFLLGVALLAGLGAARVRSRLLRVLLFAAAAVECFGGPLPLSMTVPGSPPIYAAVASLDEEGALVELPMAPPDRFQDNALYVYRSIFHRRELVNGYSGFAPESYRAAFRRVMRGDLARGLEGLAGEGVRFVLAHEGRLGPRIKRQLRAARNEGLLQLLESEETDRLYRIHR
jgi:hypothetical protein